MSSTLKSSAAALLLALACLYAAPGQAAQNDVTDVIFETVEKRLIREYFASQDSRGQSKSGKQQGRKGKKNKHGKKGLPPGLAKRGSLPPGLAKRQQLPPGLAKRNLPNALNAILPNAAAGTERIIVGRDVVLIQKATGVVLDILLDVVGQEQ
jgi:Ni/Co efflux regulator RcnB